MPKCVPKNHIHEQIVTVLNFFKTIRTQFSIFKRKQKKTRYEIT